MPRSTEELRASIELAKAATPGGWIVTSDPNGGPLTLICTADGKAIADTWFLCEPAPGHGKDNARFIADAGTHRLTDLTDLLATREEVERLRGLLQKHVELRETQRKRESEEFHIPAHTFMAMWDELDRATHEALKETTP